MIVSLLRRKAEVDRFVETKRIQSAPQKTLLQLARLILAGSTGRRQFGTDFVETSVTCDFLNQIFFLLNVDAPRRHSVSQCFRRVSNGFETKTGKNTHDLIARDRNGSQFGNPLGTKSHSA